MKGVNFQFLFNNSEIRGNDGVGGFKQLALVPDHLRQLENHQLILFPSLDLPALSSMESLHFSLFLLLSVHVTAVQEHHRRQARSIWDLAGMIRCSTKRSISYLMYGCHCGIGGKGRPKDGTDWCCFDHDCCYANAERAGCRPKSDSYNWYCRYNTPRCGFSFDHCKRMICECDMKLSLCLKKNVYWKRYALWPNFLCGRRKPHCYSY
ncbi:hypothetical protein scyTo_0012674 [Scyliorhinus torazame]|uniref:Phospholipase A2 n=1 Tax=Scyliorhinus torazame TaxID=75743 RepID=A0A401NGM9_SCYTO|nr:hypothetical protein [Scyliorhinus torazame]